MAGEWSAAKVKAFKEAFFQFLDHVYINSKDLGGNTCLGRHVYRAQKLLFRRICDGLRKGKHNFFVLKARQLGVSTFSRALSVFWLGMHDGLEGAIVFDTDSNRNKARREIEAMIRGLPAALKFPKITLSNRDGLTLENDSTIQFLSAGVGGSRSSGGLGRSSGLSYGHMSEMCSWTNAEGVESLKNAFSDINPDRFYIWESTARGWGLWSDMWEEARLDENHSECIFLGWWSKDSQKIDREDPDFDVYGSTPPTDRELERIKDVFERYGHQITPEQLAWIRRKMDPAAKAEGDADADYEGNEIRLQEQPWVEEDAFQMTAATFFEPTKLAEMAHKHVSNKYKTYAYTTGIEFTDCRVYPASNAKSVQLKVWEEPEEDGIYVIAADPAFGHSELSDRSAIQVLRCYADGVDQVAEYAWPLVNTRQFAWVIASLLGWYGECYLILELNGPGEAVWQELQSLKRQLAHGYQMREVEERGLRNMFQNVKNYLYGRSDSMSPGRNFQWKTTQNLKISIMERLRDFTENLMLNVRSIDTLEEMKWITREGDSIGGDGSKKDDRVMALALAIRCWEERVRRIMAPQKRTRAAEAARRRLTIRDQVRLFNEHQLTTFFAVKQSVRRREANAARRASWRSGR